MSSDSYPLYGVVLSAILDRAYASALSTVPEQRAPYIEEAMRKISVLEPDADVISLIANSTRREASDEGAFRSDDSGELLITLFTATIIRLTDIVYNIVYAGTDKKPSLEATVYNVCNSLGNIDPGISTDMSPFNEHGKEFQYVDSDGWITCALISVSPSPIVRESNAKLELSDMEFALNLASPIRELIHDR